MMKNGIIQAETEVVSSSIQLRLRLGFGVHVGVEVSLVEYQQKAQKTALKMKTTTIMTRTYKFCFLSWGISRKHRGCSPAEWVERRSLSGKKFESPKKSNLFPLKLCTSKIFWVHMDPEVLQRWQWKTTHFKAYSK